MSVNGQLQFGFPYPPLSLFMALPGYLFGDYRYAQLAAMDLAGAAMGLMSSGSVGTLAAALYLFTPRNFFVLEQGWTEPFGVLLVALVCWCAHRRPAILPYVLGMLFAVKQYMVLAFPPSILLLGSSVTLKSLPRFWARALAVTLALTAPLALWHWRSFFHSVVALQFFQPFRGDALSFLVMIAQKGGPALPSTTAFAAAAVAMIAAIARLPRTAAGFAGALSLTFLLFFAFNKQAFANYYFLVIGTLCCGVAAEGRA
jgi:hypothetical protein